ncbi:MAG TPA: glycosyltransferase family 2 protein, partial [Prolixibacteraceae bacterium]|nr:glycosyltransferase family 2 protein [Prolixibacteraceae bacterium]
MEKIVTCFLAGGEAADVNLTVSGLRESPLTGEIFVFNPGHLRQRDLPGVHLLEQGSLSATEALKEVVLRSSTPFTLLYTKPQPLIPGPWALERMTQVVGDTAAGLVYSDYYAMKEGKLQPNPVIDYHAGSLRDDFNFGSVWFYDTAALEEA